MVVVKEAEEVSAAQSEILTSREAKALSFTAAGPREMWLSGTQSGLLTTESFASSLSGVRTLLLGYGYESSSDMSAWARYTTSSSRSLGLTRSSSTRAAMFSQSKGIVS